MTGDYRFSTERLVYFSDAVVAITITLLVLDIRLPEGVGDMTDTQLWAALLDLGPAFRAYLISFAVIGSFWISHHRKFAAIAAADGRLIVLNLLFLLMIGAMPFATSLIAENPGPLATALYAGALTAGALMIAAIWVYARAAGLTRADLPPRRWRASLFASLAVAAVFALSVPVALIWPDPAKLMWILAMPPALLSRLGGGPVSGEPG
ncbi:MAG: DUF1211 domain-containing protein [Limimaricola sp.]|uniref:TMEM175 family protein n=1 Tax=Limimaricola sp. TaxID=2211665 RepID=UPI001E0394B7|nr:TMEM175 family protein [Limimaricola sp.]MBI1418537.1 DUF1211 domain-containing protein [Limimaricola sp.]